MDCPGGRWMETTSATVGLNQSWNPTSRIQVNSSIELGGVHASLFEQILSLPLPPSELPQPTEQPEPPREPAVESKQESAESDNQSSDESPKDNQAETSPEVAVAIDVATQLPETLVVKTASHESEQDVEVLADENPIGQAAEFEIAAATEQSPDHALGVSPEKSSAKPVSELPKPSEQKESEGGQVEDIPQGDARADTAQAPDVENDNSPATEDVSAERLVGPTNRETPPRREQRSKWYEREDRPLVQELSSKGRENHSQSTSAAAGEVDGQSTNESQLPDRANPIESPPPSTSPSDTSLSETSSITDLNLRTAQSASPANSLTTNSESDSGTGRKGDGESTQAPRTDPSVKANDKHRNNATATPDAAKPDGLSQQERVRLVQRIARSFNRLSPTGGQINLRLHPPHLGSLSVQVKLEGRDMTAKLSTETAAAREVILENLPALRSRLAEQGFEVSQFQVEVAGGGADTLLGNGHGQTESQSQDSYRTPPSYRAPRPASVGAATTISNSTLPPGWFSGASIDLHV